MNHWVKRLSTGLVDRQGWPSKQEIATGSFQPWVKVALVELHDIADALDAQVVAGGLGERLVRLERALAYYADHYRYSRWGTPLNDHWVFNPFVWGGARFRQKPPEDADQRPWGVAQDALAMPDHQEMLEWKETRQQRPKEAK